MIIKRHALCKKRNKKARKLIYPYGDIHRSEIDNLSCECED
jgi:hypothetical protein